MTKRRYPRGSQPRTGGGHGPAGSGTGGPKGGTGNIADDGPLDNLRTPVPKRPEPKKFNAPLLAGGVVAIGLIIVVLLNVFGPKTALTVDALNTPAVAALDGGSEVYPPNSELAFTENVKFGYLPAPTLGTLGDGTIVAVDPLTQKAMGLKSGLTNVTKDEFLGKQINPPRKDTAPGKSITWDQIVDKLSGDTVLMPRIESAEVAVAAIATVTRAKTEGSTIIRTSDAEVAKAATDAGIVAMFVGDPDTASAKELKALGYTMIVVPAAHAEKWFDSGLAVWATGVKDKKQLDGLARGGLFGALATNPYTIQPSAVKTD